MDIPEHVRRGFAREPEVTNDELSEQIAITRAAVRRLEATAARIEHAVQTLAEHAVQKSETVKRTPGGAPILGGTKTMLHQNSVSKTTVATGPEWRPMDEDGESGDCEKTENSKADQAKRPC